MPLYQEQRCVSLMFGLLLLTHLGHACDLVENVLKEQQKRHYMLIRRGAPGKMVRAYYQQHVLNYIQFVNNTAPGAPEVGKVCMDPRQQQKFASLYDEQAVNKMIQFRHSLDTHMFYLPESEYSDGDLLPLSRAQSILINWMWSQASLELNLPTSKANIQVMTLLPGGLMFFFDPLKSTVCNRFEAYQDGISETMNAIDLLYEVVALVIRLHLLGIPNQKSLQILKHHAAFTFNGIRCRRRNGFDLKMSTVFLPWYDEAFRILTENINVSAIREIPPSVVETRLNLKIHILAHYQGWGKLRYIKFNEATKSTEETHIAERLFDPEVLKLIKSDIGIRTGSRAAMEYSESRIPKEYVTAPSATRAATCKSGYFAFKNPPTIPNLVCCPLICRNTHLLQTVRRDFTTSSCCLATHKGRSLYNRDFRKLSTVHVDPYGFSLSEFVPVMI